MAAEDFNSGGISESFRKRFKEKAENGHLDDLQVREKTENKNSEKVLKVAENLLEEASSLREYDMSILLTVLAWNFSLFPEDEAEKYIEDYIDGPNISDDEKKIFHLLIEKLKRRKLKLFPDVNAFIVDYEVEETADQYRLSVACHEFTGDRVSEKDAEDPGSGD